MTEYHTASVDICIPLDQAAPLVLLGLDTACPCCGDDWLEIPVSIPLVPEAPGFEAGVTGLFGCFGLSEMREKPILSVKSSLLSSTCQLALMSPASRSLAGNHSRKRSDVSGRSAP